MPFVVYRRKDGANRTSGFEIVYTSRVARPQLS